MGTSQGLAKVLDRPVTGSLPKGREPGTSQVTSSPEPVGTSRNQSVRVFDLTGNVTGRVVSRW